MVMVMAMVMVMVMQGKTGLDLARERGHMDVVRCLQLELQRRSAISNYNLCQQGHFLIL